MENCNKITPGTTPTNKLTVPFDVTNADAVWVTYTQLGKVKVDRSIETLRLEGNAIYVELTQAETLRLISGSDTQIQIAVRFGGKVMRSKIRTVGTGRILKREAI